MGMQAGGGGNRAVPYINVTPLIDVLLVLLIIFMVITPLKPSRFKADIPTQRDPNEDLSKLKPNPLTLVVSLAAPPDFNLRLNNHTSPQPGEVCIGVVPDYGTVNEPGNLALCLSHIFRQRYQTRAFRVGMEAVAMQAPENQREQYIEKTVFVKAPRALKYGDVVKVIDAIKGAGASPVGLQVDDLP